MNIMNKVTLKGLKKNKTRTIVTIIGVILSAAMITAVTTFIASLQNYAVNITIAENGDWHGVINHIKPKEYEALLTNKEIDEISLTKSGGYAVLPGSKNEDKPYLHILEMDAKALDLLSVNLLYGTLPQNPGEVVISEHIISNAGVSYKVGDTISLDVGQRALLDGELLTNNSGFQVTDNEVLEELVVSGSRTFKVVGICSRLSYELEPYKAAGYTIITAMDQEALDKETSLNAFIKTKKPDHIYEIVANYVNSRTEAVDYNYNYELLRFLAASNEDTFNSVLYSLGAILIGLIMMGSISLIYNSFAISVSERKKMFGLLASTGATSRQRRNSVFFEASVIAAIGIPIGVLSGIAGIGITLYFIRDLMGSIINSDTSVTLTLAVSLPSVLIAAIVALVTILISAYIPAGRSKKVSPMDAIRQTQDIRLTARRLRTSKLTRKIFGIEGDLALKNLKRNRRRYRSTVISLFISVVLFVTASSFGMYLEEGVTNVYDDTAYDLSFYTDGGSYSDTALNQVFEDILALKDTVQGSLIRTTNGTIVLNKDQVLDSHYSRLIENGEIMDGEDVTTPVTIFSVDHATFQAYIDTLEISEKQFADTQAPEGILIDLQHYYNPQEQRYNNTKILKDETLQSIRYTYFVNEEEQLELDISIAAYADEVAFGVPEFGYGYNLMLIVDEQQREHGLSMISEEDYQVSMYFSSKDPDKAEKDIKNILLESGMPSANLFNYAAALQDNRNILTIISVFAYGFITLISLITIANVFNTISTNVNLRRREFAMLKSVGMTNRGFNKMLNYECIFYGLKSLLYGLPVSIVMTYLIYLSLNNGVDMAFRIPVQSIIISICSVFIVVFVSMMYSMRKIRKENVLDALKNENL